MTASTDPLAARLRNLARTPLEIVCGTTEAGCRCTLPPHDGDTHVCDCGGSWRIDPDGTLTPLNVPGTGEEWGDGATAMTSMLASLFGFTDDDDYDEDDA